MKPMSNMQTTKKVDNLKNADDIKNKEELKMKTTSKNHNMVAVGGHPNPTHCPCVLVF